MLDVALINLIAVGIERICRPPTDGVRPMRAEFDRERLIEKLTAAEPDRMSGLIAGVVEAIWQNCRTVGLPAELAEPHIEVLSEVFSSTHLRASDQAMFCVAGHKTPINAVSDLARRVIAPIEPALGDSEIDATILNFLLESFLTSLYERRALIQIVLPIVNATVVPSLTPEETAAEAQKAAMLAKIERADALGIPVSVLETITVSLINTTRSADLRQADLLGAAADARALSVALERLPEQAPDYAEPLSLVPGMFRTGRYIDCDRHLGSVEDLVVRHSIDTYAHAAEHVTLAIELRTLRACLATLEGSFTKAARHYGFAQRYIVRADIERRWKYARLEAHYYELAAFYRGDASGLDNAARACTSALATMPVTPSSVTRACAQTGLAHILIVLGEQERRPDRFELAAQLLGDAADMLAGAQQMASQARRATILRATALCRLGEWHRKSELLEQAATLFQSILTSTPDDGAEDQAEIELGLRAHTALAMVGFAGLMAIEKVHDQAIDIIHAELPELLAHHTPYNHSGYNRCLLAARCHQALADWYDAQGEHASVAVHLAGAAGQLAAAGFASDGETGLLLAAEPDGSVTQADAPSADGTVSAA